MSTTIDGVSKYFIVHHEGTSMHFEGYKTRLDAALHLVRMDMGREGWEERLAQFRQEFEHTAKYHNHDHEWKPDDNGQPVCECGETYDEGWYCPDSPSHICSYEKGDSDQCDYCGQPDERK